MRFSDIPMLPGGHPVWGHTRQMKGRRGRMILDIARARYDIVRIRFPFQTVVAVNGVAALYDVLVGKARLFQKSPMLRGALFPLAGDGLFTSEGALWKRQRKLMAPLFRKQDIARYGLDMGACAERAAASWADGETVDAARETTRIAMSVAGKTLFDADTFTDADELGEALTVALEWVNTQITSTTMMMQARLRTALLRAQPRLPAALPVERAMDALLHPVLFPSERTRELRRALAVLNERVDQMIADRRAAKEPPPDLLTQLLNARDDDGTTMSDRQVRDEILTLFIAGHETTASGLAWALYLLGKHPEAMARAVAEADALPGPHVGAEDAKRLPFCLQVFKESLRMYAPIYMFGRQAIEDVELDGYPVRKGTIVLISPYALHHREDLWPNPDVFDPSRFTPEAEQARPREAYLPFSGGPRTCIGNHFALMEGPIVLATLLRRAKFELLGHRPIEPELSATLRPQGGVPMRVTRRRQTVRPSTESRATTG